MVAQEQIYTLADLRELEGRSENRDKRFELLRGVIYEVPTGSPLHALIIANILFAIQLHIRANQLGFAFGDSVSYTLPNGDELIPDVSFVASERQGLPLPDRFLFAPDLTVEVVSPSNREREMLEKVESYLEAGTRLAWVVYPTLKVVDVYRRNADGSLNLRKVDANSALAGEDALSGLQLPIRDLFPGD